MSLRSAIVRGISLAIVVTSALFARPATAGAAMCGEQAQRGSCGTCCYGGYSELERCCIDNGCTAVCELNTSFCCPGGYQLNGCGAT